MAALFGRIASNLACIAPLMLGLASCTSEQAEAPVVATELPAPVTPEPGPSEDPAPRRLGTFKVTFYYVIGEDEVKARKPSRRPAPVPAVAANDNQVAAAADVDDAADADAADPDADADADAAEIAAAAGSAAGDPRKAAELASIVSPDMVTVSRSKDCKPIAKVSREFARQLSMQGTGKLKDGRTLNVMGHCDCEWSPCFKVTSLQWGNGGTGRPLQPFRTVAVDPKVIKLGSLLYLPELAGRLMPGRPPWGGFVHDGCVTADDVGGAIKGKELDFFVGRRAYYHGMSKSGRHAWARRVDAYDGSKICERNGREVTRRSDAI